MFLRNLDISKKLMLINLIASGFAMMLLISSIAFIVLISSKNNLVNELNSQAHIMGENLAASIAFNDTQSAQALLKSLHWTPYIKQVVVLDNSGKIFTSYPQQTILNIKSDGVWESLSSVQIQQQIKVSNQKIGEIYIHASLKHIYAQLGRFLLFALVALIFAAALGVLMLRRLQTYITKPIVGLTNSMRVISSTDNYALRFNLNSKDELGELASGFNIMLSRIQSHQTELDTELTLRKQAEDRLHRLAFYDDVTQLPNRHYFKERLESAIASARRNKTSCCVMVIDLDDFKIVNDTLGHHVGDDLLLTIAQHINHSLRTSDMLCRIGGDEFALILENQSIDQVKQVSEKIIDIMSLPFVLDEKKVFISASIGASLFPEDTTDIPTLLRNADAAMYSAKNNGKNHCQMYVHEMEAKNIKRFSQENALRLALEQNELFLVYQPQIDLGSNKTVGFEALLRWDNPNLGFVDLADFIPIAEETGLIIPIGEYVLNTACLQAQKWRERFGTDIAISVNLSGRQLLRPNIVGRIIDIVDSTGLPYHLLDIELTESILMDRSKETLNKLEKLSNLGITISVDDFGTGYSSMSYLKRYPIDTLKIDQSFISDLPGDANDAAITLAIIAMGKSLGMTIIAEGVETEAQLAFLKTHECNRVQGYLLGHPMSAEKAEQFMIDESNLFLERSHPLDMAKT